MGMVVGAWDPDKRGGFGGAICLDLDTQDDDANRYYPALIMKS